MFSFQSTCTIRAFASRILGASSLNSKPERLPHNLKLSALRPPHGALHSKLGADFFAVPRVTNSPVVLLRLRHEGLKELATRPSILQSFTRRISSVINCITCDINLFSTVPRPQATSSYCRTSAKLARSCYTPELYPYSTRIRNIRRPNFDDSST